MRAGDAAPKVELPRLRQAHPAGLSLRFAFGFVISIAAALLGMRFGDRLGGLFLAFPAILPASLTLIEKKHGDNPASINAAGAVLGGAALVTFAVVAAALLRRVSPLATLAMATITWLGVAVLLYFGMAALRSAGGRRPEPVERES